MPTTVKKFVVWFKHLLVFSLAQAEQYLCRQNVNTFLFQIRLPSSVFVFLKVFIGLSSFIFFGKVRFRLSDIFHLLCHTDVSFVWHHLSIFHKGGNYHLFTGLYLSMLKYKICSSSALSIYNWRKIQQYLYTDLVPKVIRNISLVFERTMPLRKEEKMHSRYFFSPDPNPGKT